MPTTKKSSASLRVLHITARADVGGGQESMHRLMVATGNQVDNFVCSPNEEPYWGRFQHLVPRERICEIPHRRFQLSALRTLVRFIKESDISVMHSHGLGAGIYARLARLFTGVPVVHTFHGLVFHANKPVWSGWRLAVEWLAACVTAALIAVSDSERRQLVKWLAPHGGRIQVIHNGMKPLLSSESRDLPNVNGIRILWIGRLHEQKNPELLIEVVAELYRLRPQSDFVFEVVGDGPLAASVNESVTRAGITNLIRFHGAQPSTLPFYLQSSILISTSRWEGLPNCILEAMYYGLLVLATRVQGNTDLVEDLETGLLFEERSASQAAQLLSSVMDKRIDPEPIRQRGTRLIQERFGLKRCADEYLSVYRRVCQSDREGLAAAEGHPTPAKQST